MIHMLKLMTGGKIMSELVESSFIKFHSYIALMQDKGVNLIILEDPYNKEKFDYIIPYQEDTVNFINDISGIPKNVMKQFITLNQFRYIVNALPEDISLHITVDGNNINMRLGNNRFRHSILGVDIHAKKGLTVTFTYRNKTICKEFSYEDAYKKILNEVKVALNLSIIDFSSFLKFYNTSTEEVIQEKIKPVNVNYMPHSQFCMVYNKPEDENVFFIMPNVFDNFIKDMFPENTYKKLLQLINLGKFNFYLSDRDNNVPIKIIFPPVSKYLTHNNIVAFEFLDITVSFLDDGKFFYEDAIKDIPVYLHDIDDIYNYLLGESRQKISNLVGTSSDCLTFRDLSMYKIMIY